MTDILMDNGLLASSRDLILQHISCQHPAIVYDQPTFEAAGETLLRQYEAVPHRCVHLGKRVRADTDRLNHIIEQCTACDAIIAVGSGTINDLCKVAAARLDLPYVIIATAPSMNGYLSANASIASGKRKQSVAAKVPELLIADLDVLAVAPLRLIRAGIGDTLCRSTIQADWLLAHHLLGVAYDPTLFDSLQQAEENLLASNTRSSERTPETIQCLMLALLQAGRAMTSAGSSKPASQSEHMIVHCYHTMFGDKTHNFHGEEISVTTASMIKLQQKLMKRRPRIHATQVRPERFDRLFGYAFAEELSAEYAKKTISHEQAEAINDKLATDWPAIRDEMRAIQLSAAKLEMLLKQAGCPTHYKEIHWLKDRYEHAFTHAHLTRDRFTFLDLAAMDKTLRAEV